MDDFFPEALVTGEAPAYAFRPRASLKRVWSSSISARIRAASWMPSPGGSSAGSRRPGAEGRLFHRLGELVRGGAGGFQLDEEGEHLLTEGVLDQRRLVRPLGAEDVAEIQPLFRNALNKG